MVDDIRDHIMRPQGAPDAIGDIVAQPGDDTWWTLDDENPYVELPWRQRKRWADAIKKRISEENELLEDVRGTTHGKKDLERALRRQMPRLSEFLGGARIKLTFYDLRGKERRFSIDGNAPGWSASIIKVPVMAAVARAYDEGRLSPDSAFTIDHKYTLEKTDPVSMIKHGERITADELVRAMIGVSDNEATNMLADRIGLEYINETAKRIGTRRTTLAHLLAPRVPRITCHWNPDGSNLTTTDDMALLLKAIYTDSAASAKECERMRGILEGTAFGSERPAMSYLGSYLPKGTVFGAKVGYITDDECGDDVHDVGAVGRDYIITIMCNRIGSAHITKNADKKILGDEPPVFYASRAPRVIATLSRIVFDAYHRRPYERRGAPDNAPDNTPDNAPLEGLSL